MPASNALLVSKCLPNYAHGTTRLARHPQDATTAVGSAPDNAHNKTVTFCASLGCNGNSMVNRVLKFEGIGCRRGGRLDAEDTALQMPDARWVAAAGDLPPGTGGLAGLAPPATGEAPGGCWIGEFGGAA